MISSEEKTVLDFLYLDVSRDFVDVFFLTFLAKELLLPLIVVVFMAMYIYFIIIIIIVIVISFLVIIIIFIGIIIKW